MPTARFRPKMFPPPEFPPRRKPAFAQMPPAVFPSILGLLGLGLALRRGLAAFGLGSGLADLLLAMGSALWAFALAGYLTKLARRGGVLAEDLRVLPGRNGLATATMGGMAVAAGLVPIAPRLAAVLLVAALLAHLALAVTAAGLACRLPAASRPVDPGWHLVFVGFIVGGVAAAALGLAGLAAFLFWTTLPLALAIWLGSALQFRRTSPAAPLRPLLAIHLSPAALFATVAPLLGHGALGLAFLALGGLLLAALVAAGRWVTAAGFSPLWGAFTFPLAAYTAALFVNGFAATGAALLAVAAGVIPAILVKTLALWASGSLAAKTNAASA